MTHVPFPQALAATLDAGQAVEREPQAFPQSARRHGFTAPLLLSVSAPVLLFLVATVVVTLRTGIEPSFFTRDPASTLGGHPLTGLQSHLGVLLWCATASICVFCAAILERRRIDPMVPSFLLCFGLLTFVLAFDDLFRVHEDLARRYLGIRQRYVILAYGVASLACLLRFRRVILRSEYALLFLAFLFFGVSLVFDVFEGYGHPRWGIFFEDGFKLLGIAFWGAYLIRAGLQAAREGGPAGGAP